MNSDHVKFESFAFGPFEVSVTERSIRCRGEPLIIGERAFDLLVTLARGSGTILSKDELFESVWPNRVVDKNTLESHMSSLRKALGAERSAIRTISGRGYQFVAEINSNTDPRQPSGGLKLPERLSPLIGREKSLSTIAALVKAYRLVTLVGAGGVGKTSLAIEAARSLSSTFFDGVCFAELENLPSGDYVPMNIAAALGFPPADGCILENRAIAALGDKRILLVLDNCEHLIDASASTVETLLRCAPFLAVLATSREPLRIVSEHAYQVPALAVPLNESSSPEELANSASVRLLDSRLKSAGVAMDSNAEVVRYKARICKRLDGIPLAIELAAANVALLGAKGVADRLDDQFALFTKGRRAVPSRQQTLRHTFDWSYDLLPLPERVVFARLSVFVGGFSIETALTNASDSTLLAREVMDAVVNLVSKSLITATQIGGTASYRMPETTRTYAAEKLLESGEHATIARRHAEFFLAEFERVESDWGRGEPEELLHTFRHYHDDLRFALGWCFASGGDPALGIRLVTAAVPYWMKVEYVAECHLNVANAIAQIDALGIVDAKRSVKLHLALGAVLLYEGLAQDAQTEFNRALELAGGSTDVELELKSLHGLWATTHLLGPFDQSLSFAERFSQISETAQRPEDAASGIQMLGASRFCLGDLGEARSHLAAFLSRAPSASNALSHDFQVDGHVAAECALAHTLWVQGYADQAKEAMRRAMERADTLGHALNCWYSRLMCSCPLSLLTGPISQLYDQVNCLSEIARIHGMATWTPYVDLWKGLIISAQGDATAYDRLIDPVFASVHSGWRFNPYLTGTLSELCSQLTLNGRANLAAKIVANAIEHAERTGDRTSSPELHRIAGEIFLRLGTRDSESLAEQEFVKSIDSARERGLLAWQLRAALSLARVRKNQSRHEEARTVIEDVRSRFTEGLSTADLLIADSLLSDLS
ncbi:MULTISPECIES: winged helix-turn-helix domain-containing protein [Burkholderiaceae]|uniref:Signal transduction response regulator / Disease resistance domain-containing protein n=1 Tax=Caballeronia sordidicola TaxID=196367 RepID=A0A242ML74_CABSO|nr:MULTISPECIES: winged helix-turn-helix domain-containing protein [Burkholderiaceae]AME27061.2 hypothetical protein AXG89_24255 [Burkholderia sp. PAMC 26561]AME27794.2 hypothetical protein AXG89_28435 [Burkholderia sp. PAMC 26561]OTP72057.1 Signal transduction response regulator / Disease resistance domain-containing protein [Caballeronia sordidicola]